MASGGKKEYEHLTNMERMLGGHPYYPFTEELTKLRVEGRKLVRELNASDDDDEEGRIKILKRLFNPNSTAVKMMIEPPFRCDYGWNITVGENFFMNFDCCILDVCPVKIGKNFMAGPGVHIYGATHPTNVAERRDHEMGKPITIGDDVWIGGLSVICPGVTIGNGVTVGAGSVVTKDVPDYCVVAGNPAKIIRRVENPDEPAKTNP